MKKRDWILLVLSKGGMERVRLMLALFLIWHRKGRQIPDYFEFEPYLYGPCSLEVYTVLMGLEKEDYVVQPLQQPVEWVECWLTSRGKEEVERIKKEIPPDLCAFVQNIIKEITPLSIRELQDKIEWEAPDFARELYFTLRAAQKTKGLQSETCIKSEKTEGA